ncbi:hypothetical protein HanHA300_Chr01g0014981 [Helianthus annuus]|nr:hypothetical protein HanHA300_Chr01g0014981 [Helianthus annuus]KAJ0626678.1 hypothetical protein HanHA89_Chr01g0016601 [Helianthus annuus]
MLFVEKLVPSSSLPHTHLSSLSESFILCSIAIKFPTSSHSVSVRGSLFQPHFHKHWLPVISQQEDTVSLLLADNLKALGNICFNGPTPIQSSLNCLISRSSTSKLVKISSYCLYLKLSIQLQRPVK